jgi:SAM-dependent methyltransferase
VTRHAYDAFAPHFDAWQRAFGAPYDALILPRVRALLARHAPGGRRLADLGSGTGDLALALAREGWSVVGIDRSESMLAVARAKAAAAAPAGPVFVAQDLRALRLEPPIDAAVCVYTVMNQLTGDGDLAAACRAVAGALVAGGVFVFELHLPAAYERFWTAPETVSLPDAVVHRVHRRVAGTPVIVADVTIRRRTPDGWRETHDRIEQRPYDDAEVRAALDAAGLAVVAHETFDPFEARGAPLKALWAARLT